MVFVGSVFISGYEAFSNVGAGAEDFLNAEGAKVSQKSQKKTKKTKKTKEAKKRKKTRTG